MPPRLVTETDVVLYCDFHGHSRKNNVFMYGCNTPGDAALKLRERVFPLMMSKNASNKVNCLTHASKKQKLSGLDNKLAPQSPHAACYCLPQFSFKSCKFRVQKSKEGTGRITMWKLGIKNSYTMEASFGGSTLGSSHLCKCIFMYAFKMSLSIVCLYIR